MVINQNVPLVSQQQISVESPANADVVTLQVGTSVRRTDKQKDNGLLLAIVDTVTLNRKTAMAVSDDTHTGGSVQKPRAYTDENPPTAMPLRHDGLSYRFPFHTEKKTYPYFDPIAQKAYDVNYDTQEDVNGLTTYRFTQNIGYNADGKLAAPVKYPSLYAGDEDGKVTTSAAMWGLQGGDPAEQITMTRYYAAQRTFWVDPASGTIVKETEHANHYFARDPIKPEVTLVDYKVTSNEDTVESQVNAARDERDRLALWSRVLPITFTAIGLIALVGGGLLASFSLRTESALTDPGLDRGDEEFFGRSGLDENGCPAPKRRPRSCLATPDPERHPARTHPTRVSRPIRGHRTRIRPARPNGISSAAMRATMARAGRQAMRWSVPAIRAGAGAAGGGAAIGTGIPVAARRGIDATLLSDRCRPRLDGGTAGDATGFRGCSRFASARRRRRGEGAAGAPGCGWRAGARPDWPPIALPDAGVPGQFVATTLAIWNPYVAERLLQGHWSLLVGYGCLPWVATAMLTLRSGAATGWFGFFGLCFWIALAGLTPTGQMLAATVALVCVAAPGAGRPRWLCAATALGAALVTALPWLTASAVGATLTRPRVDDRARGQPRSHRAPSPALARWAAWPASAESGTARPYLIRGQHFSRYPRPWCCWRWWSPGCRRRRVALRRFRCWHWPRCRWWCRPRWRPAPVYTC